MSPQSEELVRLNDGVSVQPGILSNLQQWQIREVILYGNGQPWVFARSVLPQALCERDFSELGNRPLGQIIFNDKRFVRKPFELISISADDNFLNRLNIQSQFSLWGRRSLFHFEQHHLMVAEVFLPHAPAYQHLESHA